MKMRKVVAGLLATAMVVSGVTVMPKTADAATANVDDGVFYEVFDIEKIKLDEYLGKKAPVFDGTVAYDDEEEDLDAGFAIEPTDEGFTDYVYEEKSADSAYLFGGWYEWEMIYDQNGEDLVEEKLNPIAKASDLDTGNGLVAKWVPANLLSVKGQNGANVTDASASASTRLISSVDSLDYKEVGFTFDVKGKNSTDVKSTKVYDKLSYEEDGKTNTIAPKDAFGNAANYFIVWRLDNIPNKGFGTQIYVRPYWVTADGVTVKGLPRYSHVEDGYKKLVSVPINLNMVEKAAAGVVKINCPDGYTLDTSNPYEAGRVFGEMAAAQSGNVVTCVGNVSDITTNADLNDLYINLRFKKSTEATGIATFSIDGAANDFCDNNEVEVDVNIWDVLY